jgi:hypothetical protein
LPKSATSLPTALEKLVIQEKTVCYVSNFDLQSKDWIAEFKNLDIFR